MRFEWDEAKAAANLARHHLSFEDAIPIFLDPRCVVFDVSRETDRETRLKAVGRMDGLLYVAVYTLRSGTIRLISARRANAREERIYDGDR